jgi:phosphatidylserine decarboxylase
MESKMKILLLLLLLGVILMLFVRAFLKFFYRDPERIPPDLPNVILAPADGRICYIKYIKSGEVNFSRKNRRQINLSDMLKNDIDTREDYILIGIQMSFFNVHYQRAPIDGIVYDQKYIPGKFLDLRTTRKILEFEGERNITYVKSHNEKFIAIIIQIASNSVRKIVSHVKINDTVKKGDKIGLIKFGSQVDLIIPANNVTLQVAEKAKLKAGETIIGALVAFDE